MLNTVHCRLLSKMCFSLVESVHSAKCTINAAYSLWHVCVG
uniref:Uncharacterized protein n=1 Tax=Anguilla anguilla TaxID=7936 RepID=A0A0E9X760_ANGAN